MHYIWIYLSVISLIAIIFTFYDKRAAKKHSRRIKERTLMLISILGGSAAMLLTMRAVRHKTKHAKFMIGIPIIILLQISITAFLLYRRWIF